MHPHTFEDICEFLTFPARSRQKRAGRWTLDPNLREPPAAVPPEQQTAPFEQNQARCIPKPLRSSRRDYRGAATLTEPERGTGSQVLLWTSAFVCLCDSTHVKCVQIGYTHFMLVFMSSVLLKTRLCESENPFRRKAAQSPSLPRLDAGAIGGEGGRVPELPEPHRERAARSVLRQPGAPGKSPACPRLRTVPLLVSRRTTPE